MILLRVQSKMPAKKGSIDGYNLKQKFLDRTRYIGNNFWKVLPIGSAINYTNKNKEKIGTFIYELESWVHVAYGLAGILTLAIYGSLGAVTGAWTPKQMKAYDEKIRIEQQIETEHKKEINYKFNRIFGKAITFQDSVDIYQKYNLPITLQNITFEQKEKAIKQNQLERMSK